MGIIDDIKELLGWDDPRVAVPIAQRRTQAKAAIEEFLRTQTGTQFKLPPDKFAERLRELVDAPQKLRQGAYSWCLPAAFLHSALRRFPDEMVKFGLSLYSTGAAKLGDIEVTMSDAFRDFDYPEAIRSNPKLFERNRDLYLASHADWLVLAGFQEDTSSFSTLTGSPHDPVSFSSDALVKLFKHSDLYADVTDMSSSDKSDRQKLVDALNKTQTHDVLLVGDMRRFGADEDGRHAARLVAPPVLSANGNNGTAAENETITFQFWSWGFQPTGVEGLPFDPAQNAFTIAMTRRQFAANFEIIVAEPEPI